MIFIDRCLMIFSCCFVYTYIYVYSVFFLKFVTWSQIVGMNKMAKGDKYLDYIAETLEWASKPWSASLGVFLAMKWRDLNTL